jgi:hypothetical protein
MNPLSCFKNTRENDSSEINLIDSSLRTTYYISIVWEPNRRESDSTEIKLMVYRGIKWSDLINTKKKCRIFITLR